MKSEILLVVFILTLSTKADFSDRVRKTNVKLFENIASGSNGSFVISPFSVWSVMTLLSFEAGGESRAQIKRALYLPKKSKLCKSGYLNLTKTVMEPSEDVMLMMKNFFFIDKNLKINKKFAEKIETSNSSSTIASFLDFSLSNQTAVEANSIIKENSNISNVLNENDFENSKMILTNVVSFKGLWSSPFNQTETTIEPFYDEDGIEIGKVNMMYQRNQFPFSNMNEMEARILELPYGSEQRYCMLVILPYPQNTIQNVSNRFETVTFKDIFARLKSDEEEFDLLDVDVYIPRFKISTNILLKKPLNSMGVHDIFEPSLANFKKITSEDVYISSIVHKADIEVTESGTEASASTTAEFANRISTPEFRANKPFIYVVMEKPTATVIFIGIYSHPALF